MAKEDYLTDNQARCLECYCAFRRMDLRFQDCEQFTNDYEPYLKPGHLCPDFQSILNDIVKAHKGVKKIEGITNPTILMALAERGIEQIPREAYE